MQSPPFPRCLVPPRSKYSPQHHILKHPQLPFLPQCQRPSFVRKCNQFSVFSFHQFKVTTTSDKIFHMKPPRCTLLLSIFLSTALHVSGNYVPIIRRTCRVYATLVFFTLYGWLSGRLVGMSTHPNQPTRQPLIQSEKYVLSHRYSKFSW